MMRTRDASLSRRALQMDILLQQCLRRHHTAICDLAEQRALAVSTYFIQLAPDMRCHQCEYYTSVIVQAMVQGYIERPTGQHVVSELAAVGLRSASYRPRRAGSRWPSKTISSRNWPTRATLARTCSTASSKRSASWSRS